MKRIARIVISPNSKVIYGFQFESSELLEKYQIYEIQEVLGELVFQKIGEPVMGKETINEPEKSKHSPFTSDHNTIIHAGTHLVNKEEYHQMTTDDRLINPKR